MFSIENLLSIEPRQSGINSIKLNSQNAPSKVPNLEKLVPQFQDFINVQMKKFNLK